MNHQSSKGILDILVPEKLKKNPADFRKAKILMSFLVVLWLILTLSYILCIVLVIDTDMPFGWSTLLLALVSFLIYMTGSLKYGGHGLAFLLMFVLGGLSTQSGGIYSMDLAYCIMSPLIAFLLAGKRAGLFWTAVLILFYIVYFTLETTYGISFLEGAKVGEPNYFLIVGILTTTSICGIIWVYETEKNKYEDELHDAKENLTELNHSLEQKVKERTISLEKSNLELTRSNEDLEQFAYVASHDLQEPLRMVGNFVQLLEEEYNDKLDDEGKEYIGYAVNGVTRMSVLIEELLQYSRLGKKNHSYEKVDLDKIVNEKLTDLSMIIDQKNAIINKPVLPSIICVPGQIGIIFYNLINNALKFNESIQPKIDIDFKEEKKYWNFSISDNGIGIAPEYQKQIFELFKRLHRKEEYSGTGIGLSICKKIINYHKGEIGLDSTVGKGTTFHFTISKNLDNHE